MITSILHHRIVVLLAILTAMLSPITVVSASPISAGPARKKVYRFDNGSGIVKTEFVSGASKAGLLQYDSNDKTSSCENWGAARMDNNNSVAKVMTNPNQPYVWDKVEWHNGRLPSSDNWNTNNYRAYTREAAAKYVIGPTIKGRGHGAINLWIIWGTVYNIVAGDINEFKTYNPGSKALLEFSAYKFTGSFGTELVRDSSNSEKVILHNKMISVGRMQPKGLNNIFDRAKGGINYNTNDGVGIRFLRDKQRAESIDGAAYTLPEWSPDDIRDPDKLGFSGWNTQLDKYDSIYFLDAPDTNLNVWENNAGQKGVQDTTRYTVFNARMFINWNGQPASEANPLPHSAYWGFESLYNRNKGGDYHDYYRMFSSTGPLS